MDKKILVADDEEKLRDMVCDYLEAVGYTTVQAKDGVEAVKLASLEKPDLIVMDIMMPGLDGIDSTRRIREKSNVPIIILTAKAQEADKLIGLEMGADDYVVKPFSLKELVARIRAQLRRSDFFKQDIPADAEIKVRDITVNPEKMTVYKNGERIILTSAQFLILKYLISNPGRVFTRIQILKSFQNDVYEGYERTIDVHIKNIRKIIENVPSKPNYIETVRGVGYRFCEDNN